MEPRRVRKRVEIMFHRFITLVSLCLVLSNPVLAAQAGCCCAKQQSVKPSCCLAKSLAASKPKTSVPHCCSRRTINNAAAKAVCPCCLKSIPQPLPTKSVPTDFSFEWAAGIVLPPPVSLAPQNIAGPPSHSKPYILSGPPLLALYCRWLK